MSFSYNLEPLFPLPHVQSAPKRVRALFGGKYIIDTNNAKLVWLWPHYPVYFFEASDLPEKYLALATDHSQDPQYLVYDVVVGGKKASAAANKYIEGDLKGLITVTFDKMDEWFEEDEPIYVHPKDPYKRVDVLQSSRHVRVVFKGQELANTKRPRFLHETSLPVRTYIPKADCHMEFLQTSELTTQCPYKGISNYYHVRLPDGTTEKDSVWWYRAPNLDALEVKGLVAFYDEKFDVYVDGELQKR